MLVTSFGELKENEFLDLRTAQVAIVDHIKQVNFCYLALFFFYGDCRTSAKILRQYSNLLF